MFEKSKTNKSLTGKNAEFLHSTLHFASYLILLSTGDLQFHLMASTYSSFFKISKAAITSFHKYYIRITQIMIDSEKGQKIP